MKIQAVLIALFALVGLSPGAIAATDQSSTTGVQGYDLVSYHTEKRPQRGNGHFLTLHDGATYLFTNEENKKAFDDNPEKYLPAYGGYCAFGASVGKKFVGDPEVWRIVDGALYLNLDARIQEEWLKDVPGRIEKANSNWEKIRNIPAAEL